MTDTRVLRVRLAEIAASQVGNHEEGGNNQGAKVRAYQEATWIRPLGSWPWCAAFVAWCVREWVRDPAVVLALGCTSLTEAERWRGKEARAYGWEDWARTRGLPVLPDTVPPRIGDLVTYDFSHIGIVARDCGVTDTVIAAIEGNTNGAGDRDSVTGDGVWRKLRARPLIKSTIRLLP